jgi:hypothetical protein
MLPVIFAVWRDPMLQKGLRDGVVLGLEIGLGAGLFALVVLMAG